MRNGNEETRKRRNDYEQIFLANSFEHFFWVEQPSAAAESRAEALTNSISVYIYSQLVVYTLTYNIPENARMHMAKYNVAYWQRY